MKRCTDEWSSEYLSGNYWYLNPPLHLDSITPLMRKLTCVYWWDVLYVLEPTPPGAIYWGEEEPWMVQFFNRRNKFQWGPIHPKYPLSNQHWVQLPGKGFGTRASHTPYMANITQHIFSTQGNENPAIIPLLLQLARDIESNPGPWTTYICPICFKHIISSNQTKGSVLCNTYGSWTHFTCATLANLKNYTYTQTRKTCSFNHPQLILIPNPQNSTPLSPPFHHPHPTSPPFHPPQLPPSLPHFSPHSPPPPLTSKNHTPQKMHYINFSTLPVLQIPIFKKPFIHKSHTQIHQLKDNTMLHARPPNIHPSESLLLQSERVFLQKLHCGHHPALLEYQKQLDDVVVNACPECTL